MIGINPRSSDGEIKHTLKNIRRTGEFVVNLVDEATANAMHLSSDELPEDESEFEQRGPHDGAGEAGAAIRASPRQRHASSAASSACIEIGATRELVLGEILLVHAREGIIDPQTKRISESHYRPIGRLFGSRYCTTRQRFNLPGELP